MARRLGFALTAFAARVRWNLPDYALSETCDLPSPLGRVDKLCFIFGHVLINGTVDKKIPPRLLRAGNALQLFVRPSQVMTPAALVDPKPI
jgi:arylamine N-acetyltransferase